MNFFRFVSDHDLHQRTLALVQKEQSMVLEVLKHLKEVDRRKLHVTRGYSSLFDYCVKELGYEASAAYRRTQAMRLMQELPEAEAAIREGSLSLSNAAALRGFLKKK